jgi:hypothetical protein
MGQFSRISFRENVEKMFAKTEIFAKIQNFSLKYENYRENYFTKIDAKSGNIIDLEYLGNGASD